tara:strand:+ start:384 stop:677 length:294 start_codon:yes stop_codon:yes gene_type:complete
MIMRVAPALCQTFKALTASDLYERYHGMGGQARLELDLAVASEISDQVREAVDSNKKGGAGNANAAVARRNQRRASRGQTVSDDDAVKLLKDGGFMA